MSEKITSKTAKIIKSNLQRLEDNYQLRDIIEEFKPKQLSKYDTGWLYKFDVFMDACYIMVKNTNIHLDNLGIRFSMRSADSLGLFRVPSRDNERERTTLLPAHSKGIANENDCLERVSLIEMQRLYPTLINNGLKNRTLQTSIYGYEYLYDELVTNFEYFKANLGENAMKVLRIVLNATYGFMCSRKGYFEFTQDSECPLKPFRIDLNAVLPTDKILHYATDDIMVYSNDIGEILEILNPVFEKHGITTKVTHFKEFEFETGYRRYLYRHYTGKR